MDTVEANEHLGFAADSRDYGFSAEALRALGVRRVRLLSNNPDKVRQLEEHGIKVVERVPASRAARMPREVICSPSPRNWGTCSLASERHYGAADAVQEPHRNDGAWVSRQSRYQKCTWCG